MHRVAHLAATVQTGRFPKLVRRAARTPCTTLESEIVVNMRQGTQHSTYNRNSTHCGTLEPAGNDVECAAVRVVPRSSGGRRIFAKVAVLHKIDHNSLGSTSESLRQRAACRAHAIAYSKQLLLCPSIALAALCRHSVDFTTKNVHSVCSPLYRSIRQQTRHRAVGQRRESCQQCSTSVSIAQLGWQAQFYKIGFFALQCTETALAGHPAAERTRACCTAPNVSLGTCSRH